MALRQTSTSTLLDAVTGVDDGLQEYRWAHRRRCLDRLLAAVRRRSVRARVVEPEAPHKLPFLHCTGLRQLDGYVDVTVENHSYVRSYDGSVLADVDDVATAVDAVVAALGPALRAGRDCPLYRMRASHLSLLDQALGDHGHTCRLTTPDGMPVLLVRKNGCDELAIVATVGYGDVDWFRYEGGGRDFIAPCSEPAVAAEEVSAALFRVVAR